MYMRMDVESDDEGFYAPVAAAHGQGKTNSNDEVKMEDTEDGEEEGEEVEGDDDDSDVHTRDRQANYPILTSQGY